MLPLAAGTEANPSVGAPAYVRHRPERTLLYRIVEETTASRRSGRSRYVGGPSRADAGKASGRDASGPRGRSAVVDALRLSTLRCGLFGALTTTAKVRRNQLRQREQGGAKNRMGEPVDTVLQVKPPERFGADNRSGS